MMSKWTYCVTSSKPEAGLLDNKRRVVCTEDGWAWDDLNVLRLREALDRNKEKSTSYVCRYSDEEWFWWCWDRNDLGDILNSGRWFAQRISPAIEFPIGFDYGNQ